MRYKWIRRRIAPEQDFVGEHCAYCGEIRFRYRSGHETKVQPCDWTKIRDRALLAAIVNARLIFFGLGPRRPGRPKKRPIKVAASMAMIILILASCGPPRDASGHYWTDRHFLKKITAGPSVSPHQMDCPRKP